MGDFILQLRGEKCSIQAVSESVCMLGILLGHGQTSRQHRTEHHHHLCWTTCHYTSAPPSELRTDRKNETHELLLVPPNCKYHFTESLVNVFNCSFNLSCHHNLTRFLKNEEIFLSHIIFVFPSFSCHHLFYISIKSLFFPTLHLNRQTDAHFLFVPVIFVFKPD